MKTEMNSFSDPIQRAIDRYVAWEQRRNAVAGLASLAAAFGFAFVILYAFGTFMAAL